MALDPHPTNPIGKSAMGEVLQLTGMLSALSSAATEVHEQGDYYHAVVPQGYKLEDISRAVEKMQGAPRRKSGTVQLKDLDSLLLYCADQNKDGEGVPAAVLGYIFADPDQRKITAVFNDHRENAIPGWRDFRAEYKADYTPEFAKWMERNKHQFGQTYELDRVERAIEDAFSGYVETLREKSGYAVLLGTP